VYEYVETGRKNVGDQGESGERNAQQMEQARVAYTVLILRINQTCWI
jgi:hypothetical protein